ncbi:MAG: hypothetical protein R3358_05915 [Woeseiaceae bacterium]|nr:hypothetical protein [Woeseiaceae bacterium]
MNNATRVNLLKTASAITIGFGLLIAAAAVPAAQAPMAFLLDLIYFPVDGGQSLTGDGIRVLSAVSGGVMAGWGVMLWLVASEVYTTNPELGRKLILASIGTWFVVDSTMSVMAGAPLNALFNVGFLVLFVVPVLKPAS